MKGKRSSHDGIRSPNFALFPFGHAHPGRGCDWKGMHLRAPTFQNYNLTPMRVLVAKDDKRE